MVPFDGFRTQDGQWFSFVSKVIPLGQGRAQPGSCSLSRAHRCLSKRKVRHRCARQVDHGAERNKDAKSGEEKGKL